MTDEQPKLFTDELAKNAAKGAKIEGAAALTGAITGAVIAASQNLRGWNFFAKMVDVAFMGWIVGWVAGLFSERSKNHNAALALDAQMMGLKHENSWLKKEVLDLGGTLPPKPESHVLQIEQERIKQECAPCRLLK